MSFIIKSEGTVLATKLTSIGRKLLASGALNFSYYTIGDSNIPYTILDTTSSDGRDLVVLRPKDKNPDISSWLLQTPSADKYNQMSSSNVNVSELLVVNSAEPRGFFSSVTVSNKTGHTLINSSTYFKGKTTYDVASTGGGHILTVASVANISVGDFVMVNWLNPDHSPNHDISTSIITSSTAFLTYKVEGITGSTLGLDRKIPNFNGYGFGQGYVYSFPAGDSINQYYGSGETTNYWYPDTLSLDGNCMVSNDPPVLNLNIVYLDTVDGVDTTIYEGFESYGSFEYIGFENYIGSLKNNFLQKAIGLIHYTNHSVANVYGEQLYGNIRIDLPTILSHKTSDNNGLTLISDTVKKTQILDTDNTTVLLNTTYYDLLVNNPSSGLKTVVGKVFNDLKVVVIEDVEVLSAMSYKSNRNWTYPALISSTAPKFSTETQLFSNTSEVLYVTYALDSTAAYDSNVSYGYTPALHCQELSSVSGINGINNSAVVYVDYSNLKFYKDVTAGGEGYTANRLKLIMQKVANSTTKPDPTAWKVLDVTSFLPNYSTFNGNTIPAASLLNQPIRIDGAVYASATTYDVSDSRLNIAQISQPDRLQFGDEAFLFGTLNCDISAIVYRTKLNFVLSQNLFNTSSNPSYSVGEDCFIDSVGVYDVNKNLVAIAKTSYPIKKNNLKTVIIEVDLDF